MLDNLSTYLGTEEYRISILKNGLHVLNYKKIIDITENEVIIKTIDKLIKIYGKNMLLIKLDKKELLIKGIIKKVEVHE